VAGVRDSFPQISVHANRHQLSRQRAPPRLWCASRSIVMPRLGGRRVTAGSPPSPSPTHNQQNCVHARKTALEDGIQGFVACDVSVVG
jgi:hypothetical protein